MPTPSRAAVLLLAVCALGNLCDPAESAPPRAAALPSPAGAPETFGADQLVELRGQLGREVIVEGRIVALNRSKSGKVRYLNFSRDWSSTVSLVLFPRRSKAPIPDEALDSFVDRKVRARGVLSEHRGALQIVIQTLAQIEAVQPDAPEFSH